MLYPKDIETFAEASSILSCHTSPNPSRSPLIQASESCLIVAFQVLQHTVPPFLPWLLVELMCLRQFQSFSAQFSADEAGSPNQSVASEMPPAAIGELLHVSVIRCFVRIDTHAINALLFLSARLDRVIVPALCLVLRARMLKFLLAC